MTEQEFLEVSDEIFQQIEDVLDRDDDFDCERSGNVLTIEFIDKNEQVVINRHAIFQEIWIAALGEGHHFTHQAQGWIAKRDHREFFAVLNHALSTLAGRPINITAH